ncbi:hypothetical protein FPZ43_11430 [Mucilaginibacter pallidiroseus]|uniref:Uncharacterized protein n=1 Tax=Mucilaginibacter pallidiroseus TaxID=2599295 RepID=A0A563UBY8_9SPHI|nr:hypothetical protein [Mucilaginibacter pallidiroseus]TWR28875.1 hypothetical protein FPZ43_11430 [Mucilaginibacter pallidiroseus]
MKLQLTKGLLCFLKNKGYRYCLSKTTIAGCEGEIVRITLTPKKQRPRIRFLPKGYDSYFNINEDLQLMANGIDGVFVEVELSVELSSTYILAVLKEVKLKNESLRIELLKLDRPSSN